MYVDSGTNLPFVHVFFGLSFFPGLFGIASGMTVVVLLFFFFVFLILENLILQ